VADLNSLVGPRREPTYELRLERPESNVYLSFKSCSNPVLK
jgi:hypothetical protein